MNNVAGSPCLSVDFVWFLVAVAPRRGFSYLSYAPRLLDSAPPEIVKKTLDFRYQCLYNLHSETI